MFVAHKVCSIDLLAIENGLIHALCLKHLTIPPPPPIL